MISVNIHRALPKYVVIGGNAIEICKIISILVIEIRWIIVSILVIEIRWIIITILAIEFCWIIISKLAIKIRWIIVSILIAIEIRRTIIELAPRKIVGTLAEDLVVEGVGRIVPEHLVLVGVVLRVVCESAPPLCVLQAPPPREAPLRILLGWLHYGVHGLPFCWYPNISIMFNP